MLSSLRSNQNEKIQMDSDDSYASLWGHVEELRKSGLKALAVIVIGIIICFFCHKPLIDLLTAPLRNDHPSTETVHTERLEQMRVLNQTNNSYLFTLPEGAIPQVSLNPEIQKLSQNTFQIPPGKELLYYKPADPDSNLFILGPLDGLFIAMKVSIWIGFLGTAPIWVLILLRFIAPALRREEKKLLIPFLLSSMVAIICGITFAFFVTVPIANQYLSAFNQQIGTNLWSLQNYLDYTLFLMLANGFAFETGAVGVFLIRLGMISAEPMIAKRRHAIVGSFILGALLTPPDILTQFMLAIPLILIYEALILYAKVHASQPKNQPSPYTDAT